MEKLKLKVCGMRNPQNIRELAKEKPDFVGFIFYPKSKRYVGENFDASLLELLPKQSKSVAVLVNTPEETAKVILQDYKFDYLQLHGEESPQYCKALKASFSDQKLIKVFSVGEQFDFQILSPYLPYVDYFLFDTKGKDRGGNGITFNWKILAEYPYKMPFFLSGGISLESVAEIKQLKLPQLVALDINSRFEIEPALKDIEQIKQFKEQFKNNSQ